jgi:hypothetical protein
MPVQGEPVHVGEDVPFAFDYDPCEEPTPPVLTGMTFQFIMAPKDGTGATVTKTCTFAGTVISWSVVAADCASRLGEMFRAQLRRVDAGSNRVWKQFDVLIVD